MYVHGCGLSRASQTGNVESEVEDDQRVLCVYGMTLPDPRPYTYDLPPGALGPLLTPHLNEPRTRTSKRKDLFFTGKHGARANDFGRETLYRCVHK